jgi:DNA-binding IclR family transcriptional regulator
MLELLSLQPCCIGWNTLMDARGADGALERLASILDLFAMVTMGRGQELGPATLGVTEVSRSLGLPKGTVSRQLSRLETVGILQRLPDRRYTLGARVHAWAQAAAPGSAIKVWARPVMEQLAREFGETVSLFIREGVEAVCIDQIDGSFPLRLTAAVGRRMALHAGSSPRALLAYAPAEIQHNVLARDSYPAITAETITDPVRLRQAIAETQRLGYTLSQNELDEGAIGISAPIRDATGLAIAAIGLAGPAVRFQGERRTAIIRALSQATRTVSMSLGYQEPEQGS